MTKNCSVWLWVTSHRLKEEKETRVEKHSNVVFVANSKELAAQRNSSARSNDKSLVVKKRKLHDIAHVPTIADLPSYELLDYRKCKSLLSLQTFFIAGFSPEVRESSARFAVHPLLLYSKRSVRLL